MSPVLQEIQERKTMIKLGVKGLADFMTSGPAKQRKILRDYKYPDADEAFAKRIYYREARDYVAAFHANQHDRDWLEGKAMEIGQLANVLGGASGLRLNHNSRALNEYSVGFSARRFEIQDDIRLSIEIRGVRVSVIPDIVVKERGKEKLVKLDFSSKAPPEPQVKIICQVMFEAARGVLEDLTGSSILYLDVPRGKQYLGARAGARTVQDIGAACENIAAIWPRL